MPYVAALGSHALIGDLITGTNGMAGSMLYWPFTSSFVDIGVYLRMRSTIELGLELVLFTLMILMLRSSDEFQRPHPLKPDPSIITVNEKSVIPVTSSDARAFRRVSEEGVWPFCERSPMH